MIANNNNSDKWFVCTVLTGFDIYHLFQETNSLAISLFE